MTIQVKDSVQYGFPLGSESRVHGRNSIQFNSIQPKTSKQYFPVELSVKVLELGKV